MHAMTTVYEYKDLIWVDLESPTPEDIAPLAEKYEIHPLVVKELLSPSDRPKVDLYENSIYLILHFPSQGHARNARSAQEVDFVIGKNFIITTHYETVDTLFEFGKSFEVESLLGKASLGNHAGYLLFAMIQYLYESLESQMDAISLDLQDAKKKIFAGEERAMVQRLSVISRKLLDFRIAIKSHGDIWASFEKAGSTFFGQKFSYHLNAISGEYHKVWNMLEGNKEILADLRETNDSLLTTKMNETMVHLTMMAFVVFPLTLIAAVFAMATEETPIVGSPNDFWKVIGLMLLTAGLVFAFFKYRRWL